MAELFNSFERDAFHLELRDGYGSPVEDTPYARWQRGEPDDYAWLDPWMGLMKRVMPDPDRPAKGALAAFATVYRSAFVGVLAADPWPAVEEGARRWPGGRNARTRPGDPWTLNGRTARHHDTVRSA